MHQDLRDEFIARVAKGKTFADVGGLWGTVNEKVSVAHKAGAREVSMLDITPSDGDLWRLFHDRMKSLDIKDYKSISSDVCKAPDVKFQVVHCSGVLYHHPNPLFLLESLRKITEETLVLTSAITQTIIENKVGTYCIPPSGVLFVPALSDSEREILAEYWRGVGAEVHGITTKVKHNIDDFGPWWWLPTAEAMAAMCESCGFKVLDRGHIWNRNAYTLLMQVR
jgi:hypothetical protein